MGVYIKNVTAKEINELFDEHAIWWIEPYDIIDVEIADRKIEPQTDWETEKRDNSLCYKCVKECDRRVLNRYTIECNQYEPKDEPQTDCAWK